MQTLFRLRQLVSHHKSPGLLLARTMSGQRDTSQLAPSSIFSTEGWICLVSGGATGIGLMASQALVAGGASKVYIMGRRLEALESAAKHHGNGKFIPLQGDITDISSIQKAAEKIKSEDGHLDLLVNNAGIAGPKHDVEKGDESAEALQKELLNHGMDDWNSVFSINVFGHYYCSAVFLPLLAAATKKAPGRSAAIINIDSISGITRTTQHHIPYNVSKSAGIQLTKMLAQEFSRPGVKVRVNSICPGIFPSEMTSDGSDEKQKSSIDAKGYREEKKIPAGRPGNDVDMSQAVLFCATNNYLNGEAIVVDGGYLLGHP